jgi:hypothetical protein
MRRFSPLLLSLCLLAAFSGTAIGQAKNNVPDLISGPSKAAVEHIKTVHNGSMYSNSVTTGDFVH